VARRRGQWKGEQPKQHAPHLIFIDETWAKTNMTRLRGRAPRGQRLLAKVPFGHWTTTTLIAALDAKGIRCSTVVDGAVNGDVFEAFVEQVLVPQLVAGDNRGARQPLEPQAPSSPPADRSERGDVAVPAAVQSGP
jgi:hypothetical protein